MRSCCASLGIILGKNTAENEGWKVPYETLSVVASSSSQYSIRFLCADRTRRDCMYRPSVMQAKLTKESLGSSFYLTSRTSLGYTVRKEKTGSLVS